MKGEEIQKTGEELERAFANKYYLKSGTRRVMNKILDIICSLYC